jgi:hypothetical protein
MVTPPAVVRVKRCAALPTPHDDDGEAPARGQVTAGAAAGGAFEGDVGTAFTPASPGAPGRGPGCEIGASDDAAVVPARATPPAVNADKVAATAIALLGNMVPPGVGSKGLTAAAPRRFRGSRSRRGIVVAVCEAPDATAPVPCARARAGSRARSEDPRGGRAVDLRHGTVSSGELAALWTWFADTQCQAYSPLYNRIARCVASNDAVLEMVGSAQPQGHVPNVLLAAVHFLLLSGADGPLARVYAGECDADPGPLFIDFCLEHRDAVITLLDTRHTNTNEVGRSAVVGPALTEAARRLGEPIGLVDVGCSAGLNLLCDQYRLDYGPAGSTGPPLAPIVLECEVRGKVPPISAELPSVMARVGIDRDPVDLGDRDAFLWQLACVWPDTGRLERTRRALEHARDVDLRIVRGDAVEELATVVHSLPAGCVPVVLTTWALAYLPVPRRADFVEALRDISHVRPLAWISGEGPTVVSAFADVSAPTDEMGTDASVLGMVVFEEGHGDATLLAFVQPHGRWIDWRA